jgi:O-antigen/teichoic acid export membrane protein
VNTARQVARGTVSLLAGQVAARALDFVLYLVLARQLGVSEFGRFTYATSFALLFNVATDLGVTTVFTREVSRAPERARALLRDALSLKALMAALTLVVVLGTALAARTPGGTLALIAVSTVAMVLGSAAGLYEGLLRAAGRAGVAGALAALGSATGLVAALALLAGGAGVLGAALAHVAARAAQLAASARVTRDLARADAAPAASPAPRMRVAMLRESLPLALSWVFIALYFRIDAVMLHALRDERAVGLYGGIYRVFEVFAMLAVAFRSVLFPVMARAADGPAAALAVLARQSLRVHLVFTVLVAVVFTFHARAVVALVLGPAYAEAAPGLAVLMWALPGSFMADTLLHLLIAQRRQSLGTWAVGATALLNVALNLVLIPRASFIGAAFATAVSEAACFALLFALFRRGVPAVGLAGAAWRPLAAGGALALVLAWLAPRLPAGAPGLALGLAASAVLYLAALAALGGVRREDLALARELVPALRRRAVEARP